MKFFLLFLSSVTWAAPASGPSWNQILETLKNNNAAYQSAALSYQATQALELGAESGYLPSLTGSLSYNQSKVTDDLGDASTDKSYAASLTVSQNLFAGLRDYYKVSQAKANTRGAVATFQTAKAQVSFDFVTAYQGLLTARENLKLAENIVERRQRNLRLVELRFEGGRENKGSVLLSEAYFAQAKYENLQAQHAFELAQTTLANMLRVPITETEKMTVAVPLVADTAAPDFESLATHTPAYQEILAQVDSQTAAIGVARSAFFPSLSLTGTMGRGSDEFFPKNDRWSLGATLSIPLFDGGKDDSAVRNASLTKGSTATRQISVDQEQVEALKQTYQKYIESIEKLNVDASFQKAATVRAEVARGQYNNGLISFNDWDVIENDLITRQKAYLQSEKERVLNEAAWSQARGEGVLP